MESWEPSTRLQMGPWHSLCFLCSGWVFFAPSLGLLSRVCTMVRGTHALRYHPWGSVSPSQVVQLPKGV